MERDKKFLIYKNQRENLIGSSSKMSHLGEDTEDMHKVKLTWQARLQMYYLLSLWFLEQIFK